MELITSPLMPPSQADRTTISAPGVKVTDRNDAFSLVSYNVLADCHVQRGDYSYTDRKYTETEFRFPRIIQEVTYLNADVICLQEVSPAFYKLLSNALKGYNGFYIKRTDELHDEGCATFYNTDTFQVVENTMSEIGELINKIIPSDMSTTLKDAASARYIHIPEVVIITKLEHKPTGAKVTVANTHIAFGDMEKPDIQTLQISSIKRVLSTKINDAPVIMCGDFNVFPGTPPYMLATEGDIDGSLVQSVVDEAGIQGDTAGVFRFLLDSCCRGGGEIPLISSYKTLQGQEPMVTTVDNIWRVCCDYVLYNNVQREHTDSTAQLQPGETTRDILAPLEVLVTPPLERVLRAVPPSEQFPSDHLPLLVKFRLSRE